MSEKDMPKVSVIIPAYNIEKYIQECIHSVLNQTYSNIEVIVINDGSTDRTLEKIGEIKDKRLIVYSQPNCGLASVRNVGLNYATSDIITFVDGDDTVDSRYIEVLVKMFFESKADICCVNFLKFYGDEVYTYQSACDEYTVQIYDKIVFLNEEYYENNLTNSGVAWGKLYRKMLFSDISYPAGRIHEDIATTYKLILKANKIAISQIPLYFYRQQSESIMHRIGYHNYVDSITAELELVASNCKEIEKLKNKITYDAWHQVLIFIENYGGQSKKWLMTIEKTESYQKFYSRLSKKQQALLSLYIAVPLISKIAKKIREIK